MKVNIQPTVALQEAMAELEYLRNRNLILAQAIHELRAQQDTPAQPDAEIEGETE